MRASTFLRLASRAPAAPRVLATAPAGPAVVMRSFGPTSTAQCFAVGAVGLGLLTFSSPAAHCAQTETKDDTTVADAKAASSDVLAATGESAAVPAGGEGDSNDSLVNAIVALAPVELMCHLGAGGVAGFTSAYAFKQIGKAAAFFCGVTFIGLQGLAYKGWLDINWRKIGSDTAKALDTDGDGKLTIQDGKYYLRKVLDILQHNLPSSGGFSAGFLLGLRA